MANNKLYIERNKLLVSIRDLSDKISKYNNDGIKDAAKYNELLKKRKDLADTLLSTNEKLKSSQTHRYVDAQQQALKLSSIFNTLKASELTRIDLMRSQKGLADSAIDKANSLANINQQIADLTKDQTLEKESLQHNYNSQLASLVTERGISNEIKKGLDEQNKLALSYTKISKVQKEVLEGQHAVLNGIKKTIIGTLETFKTLYGNIGGAFGGLVTMAGHWEHSVTSVNKELGFTVLDMNSAAKSAGVMAFFFDDVAGSIKGLTNEFGTIESATMGAQFNVNAMASLMGITNTEASQLTGQFARLNGGSADIAADMIQTTKEFAKQNNVIPSQVLSDLAGSTEEFAIFAKDGGENMIKAATGARQLGTSLQTVTGIADNLLDFETSMTKELELGAMLGKNINLNKARQLAYDGEIIKATEEVLNQVGGIEEFNRMDYFQKKQTADLIGVSVAELQKMGQNQKNIGTSGAVITEHFSKWKASLNIITNKYLGHGIEALGGWITASAQTGANFSRMGLPLGGIVKNTGKVLKNLMGMIAGPVMKGMSSIGASLAGSKGGKVGGSIKEKLMKGIGGSSKGAGDTIAGKGSITQSLGKIDMSKVLKGAAALVIVAGAVWVFGKAVQEFMKVSWNAVGMAVVSMVALVGAIALLGAIMSSGVGAVAILAGAAAMVIVASSVYILGKAIQELGVGFDALGSIGENITSLVSMIGPIGLLSLAFMGLAGSLTALGIAGIVALPALMGLSLAGPALGIVADIMGVGSSETTNSGVVEGSVSEYETQMLSKMDELIKSVNSNKDIYLDKERVTSVVMKQSEKSIGNVFGLNVA